MYLYLFESFYPQSMSYICYEYCNNARWRSTPRRQLARRSVRPVIQRKDKGKGLWPSGSGWRVNVCVRCHGCEVARGAVG